MATVSLATNSPLSFGDWLQYQSALNPESQESAYFDYVQSWYSQQKSKTETAQTTLKQQYVQLVKDLSFLFANTESNNTFLKNIDYNNEEDLIYAIPFFAKKLRQIAVVLQNKRENVKRAKLKYNLIGSNDGFEKLMYEYLLKGFTNTENSITQVPTSPLIQYFPDLSAVKDNFFIELEELYDNNSYFDSDPSVSISKYLDVNAVSDEIPLQGLTEEEINSILETRFLPRVAETPLSNIFKDYLLSIPTLSTAALSTIPTNLVYNEINASNKYLSETVYGLTAVTLKELNTPDQIFNLSIAAGNNWFYWPSGSMILDDTIFNSTFSAILINDSNFLKSGATAGDSYMNSDIILTDKNGVVEGAWLQGPYSVISTENMTLSVKGGETKDFIFPFPGINIDSKGLTFLGYGLTDTNNPKIDLLPNEVKVSILSSYYTSNLPNVSADPIYLNQTSLITTGASAALFSTQADNIIKKTKLSSLLPTYSEQVNGTIDQAYLYRYERTDLPIQSGLTQIQWPILIYGTNDNSPITITDDFCVDVNLSDINPSYTMLGAVAGKDFNTSDVIYKYNSKDGEAIEAAWLGSNDISNLDVMANAIPIYNTPAVKCAQPITGPVQSSLSFISKAFDKTSFIWMDEDTPADQVFKYIEHLPSCPYGKNMPHNFYRDQDYQNPNPINNLTDWNNCICKSVNYSPIGHSGNRVTDYNGMADYLFADPDGMGSNFTLNGWTDTRGFDPNQSPQFSFFKILDGDSDVGWGHGTWKTGSGDPMILKTGRRYTYYRTGFRQATTSNSPYLISNYQYKNITGLYTGNSDVDLTILIDLSRSQTYSIDDIKTSVMGVVDRMLNGTNNNVQISVITFNSTTSRLSWLCNNYSTLELFINQLAIPTNSNLYKTDISDALLLAHTILTEDVTIQNAQQSNISSLCNNLNYAIFNKTTGGIKYNNQPNILATKNILIFSDGVENINQGLSAPIAQTIKEAGINIYGVNVGSLSQSNKLIKTISSGVNYYFDLQTFLNYGDGDLNSFIDYIINRIGGSYSVIPRWYKATKDSFGNWVGSSDVSDMVLKAGDFISYDHKSSTYYECPVNSNLSFNLNGISFTINIKLNGWDYDYSFFSPLNIGASYGAKPFWAKVYTSPDAANNWYKGTMSFGGQIRFFNDYTPLHQPEISSMVLRTGDDIQYVRRSVNQLIWNEPLTIHTLVSTYQWNKLLFNQEYSNLADVIRSNPLDGIVNDTYIPSELTLESYSSFKPSYYNYYARNSFNYTEYLYYYYRCLNSFVYYNTGIEIQPIEPYAHLDNVHYPTVATVSFPSQAVSEKQVGSYMLPEKLGTPYYRGRGYTIELDNNSLTYIDSVSAERMYLDINKYGPRNRGLTKNDQLAPTKITNIDNKWIMEPYSSGSKGGVMIGTSDNQKLTPYQTNYELYGQNDFGLARQDDIFEFWTPAINGMWNDESQYPLNFRKELPASEYIDRKEKLLTDVGSMENWRVDIFGNDYGLYKNFAPNDIGGLQMWFSGDVGVINTISNDPFTPDKNATTIGNLVQNLSVVRWFDRSGKNNNLNLNYGTPVLKFDPIINQYSVFLNNSNLYNDLNLNTSNATMFVVGSYFYSGSADSYAANKYQVLGGFNTLSGTKNISNLTFAQSSGYFDFVLGSKFGFNNGTSTQYQIDLIDYSDSPAENNYYLFETLFSQPSSQTFINGNLVTIDTSLNTVLYSTDGFWLGSNANNANNTVCSIAEIIFYNRTLSDSERIQVENYLNNKYNLYV